MKNNYDLNMSIKKVREYSNEILSITSESSELFSKLDDLKKAISTIDNSWISSDAIKAKNNLLKDLDSLRTSEAIFNQYGKICLEIANMRENTEKKIEKIVNDLY